MSDEDLPGPILTGIQRLDSLPEQFRAGGGHRSADAMATIIMDVHEEYAEQILEAYRRGLKTAIEILGVEMSAQGYHGSEPADETILRLLKDFQAEIAKPTESRLRGWG